MWSDVDFRLNVLRVTSKPLVGLPTKKIRRYARDPVPGGLTDAIKRHQQSQPLNPNRLVFPTQTGLPDKNHELKVKWIARRAKLNCKILH